MAVAVITGAGTGIGAACVRHFLEAGHQVALIGRREGPLREVAADNPNALVCPSDVTDPEAVNASFAQIAQHFGRIDVLFNNAGMGAPGQMIDEIPLETWFNVLNVNLTGSYLCARAAFRQMRAQTPQGGRIINNGSVSAYAPRPGSAPYTTTKHAITGLTKTLSLDGRAFDIAAGQIDIGNALTEMAQPMTKGVPQADGSIKVEAVMDPEDVARTVLYMAGLPLEANIPFVTVMATKMPYLGRG
ncbi:MAG: SDR family oxidoreductase [Pseudomonadota bacterium]